MRCMDIYKNFAGAYQLFMIILSFVFRHVCISLYIHYMQVYFPIHRACIYLPICTGYASMSLYTGYVFIFLNTRHVSNSIYTNLSPHTLDIQAVAGVDFGECRGLATSAASTAPAVAKSECLLWTTFTTIGFFGFFMNYICKMCFGFILLDCTF